MNDEVSVTELLEREGWPEEAPSAAASRFPVVMVMVAVVLGCGLAAILVHIGSSEQKADNTNPAVFDVPHGPPGGLAGGGVPATTDETEVTGTSSSITVTNEAAPGGSNGLPWATRHRKTSTVTVTQEETQPSVTGSAGPPPPAKATGDHGGPGGNSPPNSGPNPQGPTTKKSCAIWVILCIPG
ncbi:MAG TPA: hypothetical protein VJT49_17585 [Amycolatopsis sp.]|uniref:hypothetical protein n=1 Tax=Amycolatopsis sp. TaxID=37632 RepID=UPI002B49E664|nr:hypothetical protein [Amycolatopsis sp.]HKS46883.1 hypothetical protein [Amycolatopsis sp.]